MLIGLMPIGDDNEGRHITPYVTYVFIAINVAVFIFLQLPNDAFTYGFSVIPQEIIKGVDLTTPQGVNHNIPQAPGPSPIYLTMFSAMFMHGGWAHLLSNMLFLWIFGDNVEDAMGHFKFIIFYVVCGIVATFAQIMIAPYSVIPSLGASGAIAGVLGGYLLMFPTRSVRVLVGYMGIIALPAIIVIGGWIALQLMSGFGSIAVTRQTAEQGGVAYFAHIGGAVAGLLLVSLFRNESSRQRVQQRMSYPAGRTYYDDRWR